MKAEEKNGNVCPYNSGVERREAKRISDKCYSCGWNTDLKVISEKRLGRYPKHVVEQMKKAEIFKDSDGVNYRRRAV